MPTLTLEATNLQVSRSSRTSNCPTWWASNRPPTSISSPLLNWSLIIWSWISYSLKRVAWTTKTTHSAIESKCLKIVASSCLRLRQSTSKMKVTHREVWYHKISWWRSKSSGRSLISRDLSCIVRGSDRGRRSSNLTNYCSHWASGWLRWAIRGLIHSLITAGLRSLLSTFCRLGITTNSTQDSLPISISSKRQSKNGFIPILCVTSECQSTPSSSLTSTRSTKDL